MLLFLLLATAPNVTVTVMLSGNAVEHQLRGLQRGTLYTVKVLSQKDSLQSLAISTTFTTANGESSLNNRVQALLFYLLGSTNIDSCALSHPSAIKASEVGARSAVIAWRSSTVVYNSYRLIYQVAGGETKVYHVPSSQAHTSKGPRRV